jgi:hypothetical protein
MRKFLTSGRRRYALLLFVVGAGSLALMGASCQPTKQPAPPPPPPGLTIAPTGHVFNTTGEVQQFVVTNNGGSTTGTLTTTLANESGTNTGDFTTSSDNCNGNTLPAGNTCTLDVTLNATGQKAATLSVADANDGAAVAIVGGAAT